MVLAQAYKQYRQIIRTYDECGDLERPVFGAGPIGATLMLIGEAPGAQEAEKGIPFVGQAGKQLDGFLLGVGLIRDEIFITNAVKYRPKKKQGNANRTPTKREVDNGRPLLELEIDQVKPIVIATLGNTPLYAVTGDKSLRIGNVHGQQLAMKQQESILFPLYHPASLIYNQKLKEAYEEDIIKLADIVSALKTSK